jgi:hypothetical protein
LPKLYADDCSAKFREGLPGRIDMAGHSAPPVSQRDMAFVDRQRNAAVIKWNFILMQFHPVAQSCQPPAQ